MAFCPRPTLGRHARYRTAQLAHVHSLMPTLTSFGTCLQTANRVSPWSRKGGSKNHADNTDTSEKQLLANLPLIALLALCKDFRRFSGQRR